MGKVIKVNFQNRSWVALNEDAPADPVRSLADYRPSISPAQNPYRDYDMVSLLQENARFQGYLGSLNGLITPEICRWGIPLYEAMAAKAASLEFRAHAAHVAASLVEQLSLFPPGGGPRRA